MTDPKTEADKKKEASPKQEREIFKWADAATKKVTLPPDVADVFKKNKGPELTPVSLGISFTL